MILKIIGYSFIINVLLYATTVAQLQERRMITTAVDTHQIQLDIQEANTIKEGYPDSAILILRNLLQLSLSARYEEGIKTTAYELMLLHYQERNYENAINFTNILLRYSNPKKDSGQIIDAYLTRGAAYQYLENFDQALVYYYKVLSLPSTPERKIRTYNNIALTLSNINQYEKALKYLRIADSINKDPHNAHWLLTTQANIYYSMGNTATALRLQDSASRLPDIDLEDRIPLLTQKVLYLRFSKQNKEAAAEFERLLPYLSDDSLSEKSKSLIYLVGGYANYGIRNFVKAKQYLLEANNRGQFFTNNERRHILHMLGHTYYETKDYKKAYDLHLAFHRLEDSIKSKDRLSNTNELETKYRTAQKDQIIAREKLRFNLTEQQHFKERVWVISIFVGLSLLLLFVYLRYYYARQKNGKLKAEQEVGRLQAMMEGEEKERTRMAQELHDGVNSSLAATSSYLQTIEQLYPEMGTAESFLKVKQLLQTTSSEVRTIAHNLSPHNLLRNGIKYTIEDFCHNLFATTVKVEVQCFGPVQMLQESTALFMYRIAQELLHNIHKHAHATEVIVVLGVKEQEVNLTIEDNGIGIAQPDQKKAGIGLENLKERVRSHHGQVTIDSSPAQGTVVFVSIPLKSLH